MISKFLLLAVALIASASAAPAGDQAPPSPSIVVAHPEPSADPMTLPLLKVEEAEDSPSVKFAQRVIKDLEKSFVFDPENPPYTDDAKKNWQPTCVQYWGVCPHVGFFKRRFLKEIKKTTIGYTVSRDAGIAPEKNPVEMSITMSKATTHSVTKGWKIGAKATLKKEAFTGEVSAEYSQTVTDSKVFTKAVSLKTTCDPLHRCEFQTWALYATVEGLCEVKPWMDCRGDKSMCDSRPPFLNTAWKGCQQFIDKRGSCQKFDLEPCTVVVPIFNMDGTPLTEVVSLSQKL